jgi:hypothetical protein
MKPQEQFPKKAEEIIAQGLTDLENLKIGFAKHAEETVAKATDKIAALREFAELVPNNLADLLQITEGQVWIERLKSQGHHGGNVGGLLVETFNRHTVLQAEGSGKPLMGRDEEALIVLAVIPVRRKLKCPNDIATTTGYYTPEDKGYAYDDHPFCSGCGEVKTKHTEE